MSPQEPILGAEDYELWDQWCEIARVHSRTRLHQRKVDGAKRLVDEALATAQPWTIAWSGGKDSTVLTHLINVTMGRAVPAFAHKDDLDFPESEPYIRRCAEAWGVSVRIVRPPISPREWMRENAAKHSHFGGLLDMHSRTSEIARAAWWDTIDAETHAFEGYFDGLCAHESRARRLNRALRGNLYRKNHRTRGSIWVAHPLHDWSPHDVYGYAVSHGVELLPLYKCVALLHREEPWRLREEWWVPGAMGAIHGQYAWLRRYYPSLWRQLREWLPEIIQRS